MPATSARFPIDQGLDGHPERRRAIEGAALSQQAQFTQAALACASASRLDINIRPQGGIDILGNERQRFEFQKCMNTSGQPLVR